MIYACILYAPAPTDPNKSRFREVLGAFPSTGNRHPLSHQNNKIVSSMAYSYPGRPGELHGRVYPTE